MSHGEDCERLDTASAFTVMLWKEAYNKATMGSAIHQAGVSRGLDGSSCLAVRATNQQHSPPSTLGPFSHLGHSSTEIEYVIMFGLLTAS